MAKRIPAKGEREISCYLTADYYHRLRRAFWGRPFSAMVNRLSYGAGGQISVVTANGDK